MVIWLNYEQNDDERCFTRGCGSGLRWNGYGSQENRDPIPLNEETDPDPTFKKKLVPDPIKTAINLPSQYL